MKHRLIAILTLTVIVSGCAASRAFRRGEDQSRLGNWDAAVAEYTAAVQADPDKPEYKIQLERAMQSAAQAHISRAREMEEKDALDAALGEYRRASELDSTNRLAAAKVAELEKIIRDRIEATRPRPQIDNLRDKARAMGQPLIDLTTKLPSLKFNNASLRDILNFIGTQSGINITYEPTFQDKAYTLVLEDVTVEQALQQIMMANALFYKVMNPKTIMVIPDNNAMHIRYDEIVMRTFYVSHADVAELTQLVNAMMRGNTQAAIQPVVLQGKTANTITVRGTAQTVNIIERLIRSNDKPRAEVVIDIQILEVNRQRVKRLGLNLTEYALGLTFSPEVAPPNTSVSPGGVGSPPPFNLNTISQGVSTADFYLSVPAAVLRFLATDSQTKLIAKPQLRGAEGAKLTLNLGDDIPVVQTVFGAAVAGGFASIPQSSFTYRTVGIIVEMTPRVTYEGDIKLEMSVESSALGPNISVAGQDVPSFSSRKVTTTLRLREGESNLLAGLLRDEQRKILSGFPGLMKVPILRSLFGQSNDEVNQSDIVMLLTPRIIRTHELTAEDLAPIYIGTQQNVGLGGPPPLIAPPVGGAPTAPPGTEPPSGIAPAPGTQPAVSDPMVAGRPGTQLPPVAAPAGAQTPNPPPPPGGVARPGLQPPPVTPTPAGALPPPGGTGVPPTGGGTVPPAGTAPVTPPRDPSEPVPAAPAVPAGTATPAQIIITPTEREFRVGGGPYLVPVSINNASRVSTMSLTLTYDPAVLRVQNVQEGTFMRQGAATASFTPRIDAVAGRVDITVARMGDQVGASGAGLIASLFMTAIGPGNSLVQVSGVAMGPEGVPIQIQFSPVTVTVR
jgi:type II secretory pathway component GspD/PulD (secretin)